MDARSYTIFLIEDEKSALESFSPLLGRDSRIIVHEEIIKKIDDVFQSVISSDPDLILIDYDLQKTSIYLGGGVASTLQSNLPDKPILLLTSPDKLKARLNYVPDELGAIDDILYKDNISEDPETCILFLINIINNFKILNDCRKTNPEGILNLMKYKGDEENQILNDSWQFQNNMQMILKEEYLTDSSILKNWSPHLIYKWFTQTLFRYPGLFYDELFSATSLGISLSSFRSTEVSKLFKAAEYQGIFSDLRKVWWRNRLLTIAYSILQGHDLGPPLSTNFLTVCQKNGIAIEPSRDFKSGEKFADTVCELLNKPFLRKNTIEVSMDNRPYFMEQARISFHGIISTDFNLNLLNPEEREIVKNRLEGSP